MIGSILGRRKTPKAAEANRFEVYNRSTGLAVQAVDVTLVMRTGKRHRFTSKSRLVDGLHLESKVVDLVTGMAYNGPREDEVAGRHARVSWREPYMGEPYTPTLGYETIAYTDGKGNRVELHTSDVAEIITGKKYKTNEVVRVDWTNVRCVATEDGMPAQDAAGAYAHGRVK